MSIYFRVGENSALAPQFHASCKDARAHLGRPGRCGDAEPVADSQGFGVGKNGWSVTPHIQNGFLLLHRVTVSAQ